MTSNDPRYHVTVDDRRPIKIDHVVGWCSVRWRHIQTLCNAKLGTRPASQQQAFAILKIINLARKLIYENFKFWGLRCQGRFKIREMYMAKLNGSRGLEWSGNDAWVVVSFFAWVAKCSNSTFKQYRFSAQLMEPLKSYYMFKQKKISKFLTQKPDPKFFKKCDILPIIEYQNIFNRLFYLLVQRWNRSKTRSENRVEPWTQPWKFYFQMKKIFIP